MHRSVACDLQHSKSVSYTPVRPCFAVMQSPLQNIWPLQQCKLGNPQHITSDYHALAMQMLQHDSKSLTWKFFANQLTPSSPTMAAVLPHTSMGFPATKVW